MKKLLAILSLFCLCFIISCGGDDNDDDLNVDNTITIGSETYDISNGAFIAFGVTEEVYEAAFALSDVTVTTNASSFSFSSTASLRVVFNLAAAGTSLVEGTYTEGDILNAAEGTVFFQPIVVIGSGQDQTTLSVTGGTIQLQGSAPDFTVQLDLDLSSGEKLSGGYSGTFAGQ